jgi:pilus assembly protein CpaE
MSDKMGQRHPLTIGITVSNEDLRDEVRAALRDMGVRILLEQESPIETLQLKRLNLDLLLIDANPLDESLEELVRRIRVVSPGTMVAVVHRSPDPEVMLQAMRAGTDEFILPPVEPRLRAAIDHIAAIVAKRETSSRPLGKVVGFVSAKGGCGATTVACHVASEFQRVTQHEILLADFDLESGIIAFLMQATTRYSILDALRNVYRLDPSLWKGLVWNGRPRLDVIPGPAGLTSTDDVDVSQFRDVFRLIRSMYGWVIADLGRALSAVTLAVLDDLDELFLVATPSIAALYQAKQFIRRMVEVGYSRHKLRLILNRVPKRHEFKPDEVQRSLGISVFAELSDRLELEEAYTAGRLLSPESELGKQFADLALRVSSAQAPEPPKTGGWGSLFGSKKAQPGYEGV